MWEHADRMAGAHRTTASRVSRAARPRVDNAAPVARLQCCPPGHGDDVARRWHALEELSRMVLRAVATGCSTSSDPAIRAAVAHSEVGFTARSGMRPPIRRHPRSLRCLVRRSSRGRLGAAAHLHLEAPRSDHRLGQPPSAPAPAAQRRSELADTLRKCGTAGALGSCAARVPDSETNTFLGDAARRQAVAAVLRCAKA